MTYADYAQVAKGQTVVGWRYGYAADNSVSYNHTTGAQELGLSMMSVEGLPNNGASIIDAQKKYYYIGVVAGTGSDDEVVLSNAVRITYREYAKKVKIKSAAAIDAAAKNDANKLAREVERQLADSANGRLVRGIRNFGLPSIGVVIDGTKKVLGVTVDSNGNVTGFDGAEYTYIMLAL